MSPPYIQINGLKCTDAIAYGGKKPKGGGLKLDRQTSSLRKYGSIYGQGRESREFSYRTKHLTSDDLDILLAEVNRMQPGNKFYPVRDDRFCYVERAWAMAEEPTEAGIGGSWQNATIADIEIIARESWQYDDAGQGIGFSQNVALPQVSSLITNQGQEKAGMNYLYASGDYSAGLPQNLSFRLTPGSSSIETDRQIVLCDQLLGGDAFQVGHMGQCSHSWESDFAPPYSVLQNWLGGSSRFDVGTGSCGYQNTIIGNNGKILLSFPGPLPANSGSLNIDVAAITGSPPVKVAYASDLSDLATVITDLDLGDNHIDIDCSGKSLVIIGVVCGASDAITLRRISGQVGRYLAESQMPKFDIGESGKMWIEGTGRLKILHALYRNRYWF